VVSAYYSISFGVSKCSFLRTKGHVDYNRSNPPREAEDNETFFETGGARQTHKAAA
jgi:hypothetical protein